MSEPVARRLGLADEPAPGDWVCEVVPREDLHLRLQDVELAVEGEPLPEGEVQLEPAATNIVFGGGRRRVELGLRPVLTDPESGLLLAPDLKVVATSFYRFDERRKETSFVLGGRILFPGEERVPVDLGNGDRLRLPEEAELTLQSLRMAGGDLELVLSGRLASIELGPTLEQMDELLPSLFVWLRTHELPTLMFSALGVVVAMALALLRLLGLLRRE